jgi:hypothetical protein
MSKQFYVYLLPTGVESLIHTLRSKLDIVLIQPSSPSPVPVPTESPICEGGLELKTATVRADCYVTSAKGADIRMRYVPNFSRWNVQIESEAIEFGGCDFDGSILVRGRFCFQDDLLIDDMIVPKRKEFLAWAGQVFRVAKKSLGRSKTLDAYVGEDAEKWKREGGRFAWIVTPGSGPIFEGEAGPLAR